MPLRILKDLISIVRDPRFGRLVASMTVMTTLSITPFLAILLSISKQFGRLGEYLDRLRPIILDYFASGVGEDFLRGMEAAVSKLRAETLGSVAFLFLLLTSTRLIHEVDSGIKTLWGETSKKPWWKKILTYWFFLFLGPVALSIVIGVLDITALSFIKNALGGKVISLILAVGLSLIYKFGPSNRPKYWQALVGASAAMVTLIVAQKSFTWASGHLLRYNEIYGSLAIIPLFIIGVMIVWYAFLFGVALTKSLWNS
jgi:membrane protein